MGRWFFVYGLSSHVLPCFGICLPDSVLTSFQIISTFLTFGFLSCFLVGFLPFDTS
jgi:hypothetical protein